MREKSRSRWQQNADVKAFGEQMIADHTGVNKTAQALVTKLKVSPEESATSQSLKKGGEDNLKNLRPLKGADFDRAYIDHEVTYHQNVIDALDNTLIPNAKNRGTQSVAGQHPSGIRGAPRACEADPGEGGSRGYVGRINGSPERGRSHTDAERRHHGDHQGQRDHQHDRPPAEPQQRAGVGEQDRARRPR